MAKLKEHTYRGYSVNWRAGQEPLETKMLDRVLELMESSLKEGQIKPILSRFDFPNSKHTITAQEEVDEFFKNVKEYFERKGYYFKVMKAIEEKNQVHYHAICIYDGNKIKSVRRFSIIMQKIWEETNHADKLNIRAEGNYDNLRNEKGFKAAFYAASYICKDSQKPTLVPYQKRYTSSHIKNASLSEEERNQGLCSIKDVCALIGLSKSSVWNMINAGKLAKPIKLGTRSLWKKKIIIEYIEGL